MSNGDAAQNGGGDVLDMTGLTQIRAIDAVTRTVTVEAGVGLGRLPSTLRRLRAHAHVMFSRGVS